MDHNKIPETIGAYAPIPEMVPRLPMTVTLGARDTKYKVSAHVEIDTNCATFSGMQKEDEEGKDVSRLFEVFSERQETGTTILSVELKSELADLVLKIPVVKYHVITINKKEYSFNADGILVPLPLVDKSFTELKKGWMVGDEVEFSDEPSRMQLKVGDTIYWGRSRDKPSSGKIVAVDESNLCYWAIDSATGRRVELDDHCRFATPDDTLTRD